MSTPMGQIMRGGFFLGVGLGAVVGAGAALVGPVIWRSARPFAKEAVKAGMQGFAAASVAAARCAEEIEDLLAEVRHDLKHEAPGAPPEAAQPAHAGAQANGPTAQQ